MKIELNRHSQIPLAKQIYQELADRILSGQFAKGGRLPSVREMARMLRVSPVTITHALEMLENQNLITRIQGKGTFVYEETEPPEESTQHNTPLQIPDYLHRAQDVYYNQKTVEINFALSTVDPSLLPTQVLAESLKHLAHHHPDILGTYGEIQGDLELRQAMAQYLTGENIHVSPQEILVTNGSQQGIDLVARSFLGPGDVVLTEEPTYAAAIDVFRSRGATVVSVPVDEGGMRLDALTVMLDRYEPRLIYTIPTFHNPTGSVMSVNRRKALVDLAADMNCLVLEDDPWSEIFFDTTPPPHIKSMDTHGNVIYLKGLSKILSPGCRIGFLIASVHVLNRLITAKTYADLGNPLLNQKVVLPIIQSPQKIAGLFANLRSVLRKRRDFTIQLLERHAHPDLSWTMPKGGFNLWLSLPDGANANDLLAEAEKRHISFLPGSSCYPGEIEWHYFRVSYSHVNEGVLQKGIKALCDVAATYLASLHDRKGNTPLF